MIAVRPCGVTVARQGVARCHRHLPVAPPSALVAFEVVRDGWPIGWMLVGRPGSRVLAAEGWAEVTRIALTETATGAVSMLLSAAARWARSRHLLLLTYTLEEESGASLRASSWVRAGRTKGGRWACPARRQARDVKPGRKVRWVAPYCRREAARRGWTP